MTDAACLNAAGSIIFIFIAPLTTNKAAARAAKIALEQPLRLMRDTAADDHRVDPRGCAGSCGSRSWADPKIDAARRENISAELLQLWTTMDRTLQESPAHSPQNVHAVHALDGREHQHAISVWMTRLAGTA